MAPRQPARSVPVRPTENVVHEEPEMYRGSMNAHTHEGEEMCDHSHSNAPAQPAVTPMAAAAEPPEESAEAPLIDFSDRDALVRAFVMQEILGKPKSMRR